MRVDMELRDISLYLGISVSRLPSHGTSSVSLDIDVQCFLFFFFSVSPTTKLQAIIVLLRRSMLTTTLSEKNGVFCETGQKIDRQK